MAQLENPTLDGFVDYKHRLAIRSKHGQWKSSGFIIGVEIAERLSYYGISSNLITFLTGKLGLSTAAAATYVNTWSGVAYMLPIFGALIADTFLGKYYTIIVSSIIYILGLGLLTLSAILPSLNCNKTETTAKCSPHLQTIIFFIALYMVAIGQGGHKPCVQAFGADQFDGDDPNERKAKSSFFNWWYFGLCTGSLIGTVVLSYTQDNLSWGLGFGIPCVLMVLALFVFLAGTMTYRFSTKRDGQSPFRRIGRVFVAAVRNRHAPCVVVRGENGDGQLSPGYKESRQYRFADKALIVPETLRGSGKGCSKSEVEEAKAVLRLFPIWATCLVFAVVLAQPPTFFTKQGATLDRSIGSNFEIPPAALQGFAIICILIFIPVYDQILVPLVRASTGKPAGISTLQRIGAGLFVSIFSMIVSALVEMKRLKTADQHGLINSPKASIPMRIWWLLPQYALFGISEAFSMVGLQEFFYDQVPDELRSVGLALYMSVFGVGSLISGGLLVPIIDKETRKGGRHSWLSSNLNQGHLDYFFWLLAGLSVLGFMLFVYFSRSYVYNRRTLHV